MSSDQTHDEPGHRSEDDTHSKGQAHNGGVGLSMGDHSDLGRTNIRSLPGSLSVRDAPCMCDDVWNLSQIWNSHQL